MGRTWTACNRVFMRLAVVEVEPRRGWSAQLEPGAVIGRLSDCDLRLADPLASRHHARIWECGYDTAIEDLGSHNGLYVNDRRCEDIVRLRPGDRVRLGATLWIVVPVS
jgi:pSer/pThr/pTyr-binding forkhead associated (FHA) protein